MTTTAGVTVPSRRPVYVTKFQISSKDKTPRTKLKTNKSLNSKRNKSAKSKGSNEEELHKSWGKSKDYAYVFTGTGDEKPWTKTELVPPTKPKSYKAKPKPKAPEDEEHHIYKIKEDGKRKVKKGTLVVSDKYFEAVKDERTRLLDLLNSLQKRNDVLERENADMVKNFEALHRENVQLRKKLDTGDEEPVIESYKRVYDDRRLLREAENSYKRRMHKLEEELKICQLNYNRSMDELRVLKAKTTKMSEDASLKGRYNKYYWDCYHLKAENDFLKATVKSLKERIEELTASPKTPKSPRGQKGPQTAPVAVVKPTEQFIPPQNDVYGQHVKYITLPEIDERRQKERQSGL